MKSRKAQRGNMAIEFAIVFPLFFLVLYAIVTYSLIFVAQQSLTLAAEEGARAALRVQPGATSIAASLTLRAQAACLAAQNMSNWLMQPTQCSTTTTACTFDTTMNCIQVTLDYDYAGKPLMPTLPLLKMALPDALVAQASVQLDPNNLF